MSAEDRATFYNILEKHVDELWLPDEYSIEQQRELLDTVAGKIVEALSSEGLAVVAQEDVLTPAEAGQIREALVATDPPGGPSMALWQKLGRRLSGAEG